MEKKKIEKYLVIVFILLLFFLLKNNSYALEDVDNYSELYKQYMQLSDEEKAKVNVIPEKYNVSLKDYNNSVSSKKLLKSTSLPQRYNLAEHYDIKVENQGQEGNCWTFASLETIETNLQLHGYGTFDFSENHLNYLESNLFSETEARREINTGGNYSDFQEYVNKKLGPVNEEDYAYYEDEVLQIHKEYKQSELSSLITDIPLAYVGEYECFPSIDKEKNNYSEEELLEFRNKVKSHIMENGALFTSIIAPSYFEEEYYNSHTNAAYFSNTSDYRFYSHSHAVAIIGWDDNFSKENFTEANRPEHDGAYIALNSWGKEFGDNGIYYISYDDVYVEKELIGIKEAVTDKSLLKNTKTFKINDKNLYNALKNNFGRKITSYNDKEQTITMLSGLINEVDYLDLSNNNISDLSGIENFTNIDTLELDHNNISSIEPLLSLHNLNCISLNYNKLTTIPTEIKESELIQLSLNYNPITNFSGLQKAKSITSLGLEGTGITENDLVYLKNLKIVNLNLSNTSIKDYTILNSLDEKLFLRVLSINHNNDIKYESIPAITSLDISNTNVNENKFAKIPNTDKLESLDISYTDIKDLSIIPVNKMQIINISGNKNLQNINTIKDISLITYDDAGISDLSIFKDFTTYELHLASNNITDYSPILENENIGTLDLTNNHITNLLYSENMGIFVDENNVKPTIYYPTNIITMKNQTYTQTLNVDLSRENNFTEIARELTDLHQSGTNFEIANAIVDYDNCIFKIKDYDEDVVIKVLNGQFSGSTITYKIEKIYSSDINYIYIDTSKMKDMYIEGESFDTSTIKIYASYDNDSSSEITDYDIEGADNLKVGENTIKISKGELADYFSVTGIAKDNIIELNFKSKDIYNTVLSKIKEIEEERSSQPYFYDNVKIHIDNNDSNKSIKMLKDELEYIAYLKIKSDELINLEDVKQLKGLCGISINGKNLENISALRTIKDILDSRDDLMDYEKYVGLVLKNNEKITRIDDDIFNSLELENTKIDNINNLTKLKSIKYTGNKFIEMEDIADNLRTIIINVSEDIKDTEKDEDGNIILPKIFKAYKDKDFEIKAYICDQIRDVQYLNSINEIELEIKEQGENLIIKYDDIKDIDYDGKNQFIEISILDKEYIYSEFDFKYRLNYKILEKIELENEEAIELEEDTISDLSNLNIYKVYSNKQKEKTNEFEYNKVLVTQDMKEIEISYSENGATKTINVPIKVKEHTHEWGKWKITKEPTTTEEGQRERVCLKNEGHKEIEKIDKLPQIQYQVIEGANKTFIVGKDETKFKIDADYSLFENGGKVFIDNKLVSENNYESKSGSTIIILTNEYVSSLSEGEHTLKVVFNNDGEARTEFTIAKASNTVTEDTKNNTSDAGNIPKTGDNIVIWINLMIVSMLGIIVIIKNIRKK